MQIRYIGASHERTITKDQFEERGVTDQEDIFIDVRLKREAELSQAAADLLLMAEPKDWEIVEAAEEDPEAAPEEADQDPELDLGEDDPENLD